jgi:hypothetical protein
MLTQIKHIQASKAAALLELEKRRKTEKQLTSELQDEIQKILEETNEGLDALGNEDVASYFLVGESTQSTWWIHRKSMPANPLSVNPLLGESTRQVMRTPTFSNVILF